jgi:uncharacterized protein with HEPN domain
MPPDVRVYLRDIVTCCEAVAEYLDNRTLHDYRHTWMLRMAVERELIEIRYELNVMARPASP